MLPPRRIKPKREDERRRSPAHRTWVRSHQCSVPGCTNMPIECAHVRLGTDGGVGLKPSDKWCISLCSLHHRTQHEMGEESFGKAFGLDLKALAAEFFARSPHRGKLA